MLHFLAHPKPCLIYSCHEILSPMTDRSDSQVPLHDERLRPLIEKFKHYRQNLYCINMTLR